MADITDIKALWKLATEVTKRLSETLTACNRRGYCDEALNNMKDALELAISTAETESLRADAAHKYSSERDAENESLMLTVGRLRVENEALRGNHEK